MPLHLMPMHLPLHVMHVPQMLQRIAPPRKPLPTKPARRLLHVPVHRRDVRREVPFLGKDLAAVHAEVALLLLVDDPHVAIQLGAAAEAGVALRAGDGLGERGVRGGGGGGG
eukprot:CAMPEP_0184714710 /NCGR_PEP_ID=MMETSP0314-20130426/4783_1 /TAXON_ID=38298 /ORGANISM="Rhodella maculata, Strain CCMP 736" /LENGTH=111 /DNA_ID=CAMNT_0027177677 /DNA_START=137 /DNA_END=469 /DNA_ORIENTATION=+